MYNIVLCCVVTVRPPFLKLNHSDTHVNTLGFHSHHHFIIIIIIILIIHHDSVNILFTNHATGEPWGTGLACEGSELGVPESGEPLSVAIFLFPQFPTASGADLATLKFFSSSSPSWVGFSTAPSLSNFPSSGSLESEPLPLCFLFLWCLLLEDEGDTDSTERFFLFFLLLCFAARSSPSAVEIFTEISVSSLLDSMAESLTSSLSLSLLCLSLFLLSRLLHTRDKQTECEVTPYNSVEIFVAKHEQLLITARTIFNNCSHIGQDLEGQGMH